MVEFIKSKKEMSEEDIKANFITPAIVSKDGKMVSISLTRNTSLMVESRLEEIRLVAKKGKIRLFIVLPIWNSNCNR